MTAITTENTTMVWIQRITVLIPITMVTTCTMDTIHTHLMVLAKRTCLIIMPSTTGLIQDTTEIMVMVTVSMAITIIHIKDIQDI